MVRNTRWVPLPGMDEANSSVYGGKIEVQTFYHPWRKLDDLFSREGFLHYEATDDGVADLECCGSLIPLRELCSGRMKRRSPLDHFQYIVSNAAEALGSS